MPMFWLKKPIAPPPTSNPKSFLDFTSNTPATSCTFERMRPTPATAHARGGDAPHAPHAASTARPAGPADRNAHDQVAGHRQHVAVVREVEAVGVRVAR